MRAVGIAWLALLLLVGCMSRPAQRDRSGEISYNRRELEHPQPGILTGPDGVWTVYRSDAEGPAPAPPEAEAPAPKKREILMCDRSRECEQP